MTRNFVKFKGFSRRDLFALAVGSGFAGASIAADDDYPQKPIRMITPNSAGSGSDLITRRLADRLSRVLGQPVIVENIPGAGGIVGSRTFVRAQPDGYTLGLISSSYVIAPHLMKEMPFKAIDDVTPIASVAITPYVLVARANFPASNVADFIRMALKEPNKFTFCSSGNGSGTHLAGAYLQQVGNFKLLHVPYKALSATIPDLVSGIVDVGLYSYISVEGLVREGRLKVLGTLSAKRLTSLPSIPAIAETIPGTNLEAWFGVLGPKGIPPRIVERLSKEINAIVASDAFKDQIAGDGMFPSPMTLAAFSKFIAADYTLTGDLIRKAGMSPE